MEDWDKSHRPMCSSVHRLSWNLSSAAKALKDAVFRGKHLFLYLYKNTTSRYSFSIQFDMEHLTLWGLCGLLIISTRFSPENQVLEFY